MIRATLRRLRCGALLLGLLAAPAGAGAQMLAGGDSGREAAPALASNPAAAVSFERIVRAPQAEPQNWLTYYGDYGGQRFSRLDQIDASNVSRLTEAWSKSWEITHKFEATPLVVAGVMYLTTGGKTSIYALDATTGRELWKFQPEVRTDIAICCGLVNRGAAIAEGKVFFVTLDATLYTLDAQTGRVLWQKQYADPRDGYAATVAPLVVKNRVIVGISGGEYGVRGFLDAFDIDTGERAWRFWTIPGPEDPHFGSWGGESWRTGGAPTWITGTYDPELDLLYWGTGNAAPDFNGLIRPGDNKWAASVVALDPDDGALRWAFQYTPHDIWDYDAVNVQILADLPIDGQLRKVLLHANKNGYFYALDRTNGQFLYGVPYARQTWTTGLTPEGRPIVNPEGRPSAYYKPMCPSSDGASEWPHMAYSPETRMAYVPVMEQCAMFRMGQAFYRRALPFFGSDVNLDAFGPGEAHGFLKAIDAASGREVWKIRSEQPVDNVVLTTAGNLVFWRERGGKIHATHAQSGEDLWTHDSKLGDRGSVMTYAVNGTQYVAFTGGHHEKPHRLLVFRLPQ